jgi:tetratricopeptide (TPR) repeat protein
MKDSGCVSACSSDMRGQRGSTVYSFLGFAIIIAVVVAAVTLNWSDTSKAPDPNIDAAEKAMAAKDWNQAIVLFEKAAKAAPNEADAYVGLSRAYVQLGQLDKALANANLAVEKRPGYAIAYGQRGIVQKIQQKYDAAMQDFTKAVQKDSSYSWAYAQRGDLYLRQNDLDKALANANRALASKGNFVEGLRLRAWILNRSGKCKEAFEDFKKVGALSPNDPWAIQDTAWFLMTCPDEKIQDSNKAMELAKKALEGPDGKDGVILEVLAEAHFKQGDPIKAAEVQKKAIEMGSKKCPDNSCTKEMQERLQKYELAARPEIRSAYEILPLESAK